MMGETEYFIQEKGHAKGPDSGLNKTERLSYRKGTVGEGENYAHWWCVMGKIRTHTDAKETAGLKSGAPGPVSALLPSGG